MRAVEGFRTAPCLHNTLPGVLMFHGASSAKLFYAETAVNAGGVSRFRA